MEHIYKQVPAVHGPLFTNIDIVCGHSESRMFSAIHHSALLEKPQMDTSLCGDLPVCVQGTLWMAAVYKDVSALAKTNMELWLCGRGV